MTISITVFGQSTDSISIDSLKKLHTLSKPKQPTYIDMSSDIHKSENTQFTYNGFTAGDHLIKAGNLAFGAFAVGVVSVTIVALNPNKGAFVGIAGGLTSTALALMAWHNVKLAGKFMNDSKMALSISPTKMAFTYNF